MSKFVETLRLKELAEEDIYFARRDQERIQALPPRPGKTGSLPGHSRSSTGRLTGPAGRSR
jgi:hypothetical protein